ncbi:MAG: hypothetical protein ABSC16_05620 [Candidatus Dormibacteria bacterium]|nr:hypothetical protein [Chloroflexota bacterium]
MAVAPEHSPPSAAPRARAGLRRPTLGGLVVGAALVAILVVICRRVGDPDFWWHMETGSWIIDHGSLPSHELFTYTVSGKTWADQEWGSEVLGDLIFRAGGFLAFSLIYTAVTWVGFWFIWRRIGMERVPALIAGACLVVAALAGVEVWGPRSQMISFALTCLTLYWVEAYLRDRDRHLYLLPLVMVVWANLHGGFVYGLAVVGLAAVTETALWLLSPRDGAHRRRSLRLWMILLASGVAGLVNPITINAYLAAIKVQTSAVQQSFIAEWQSPNFHVAGELGIELMLLLVVAAMALRRPRLWDALLTVVGIYAALSAVRNAPLAAALLIPMVAWSFGGAWERSRWRDRFAEWVRRRGGDLLIIISAGALIVTVAAVGFAANTLSTQTASTAANFPVGAADWLAAHPDVGTRMFNAYDWGGYLIYRFYGDANRRVFIYGEATEVGNPLLQQVSDVENANPDWQTILSEHGVNYVVERTSSALSMALSVDPGWEQVYDDGFAVIFVKR